MQVRQMMLAASAALALSWSFAASAQPNLEDFRKGADAAYNSAMGGAMHCDKGTVMRARADITRMLAEIDKIARKSKGAGKYGTSEEEIRSTQKYLQGIADSIDKMTITGCDEMFGRKRPVPTAPKTKEEPKPATGEIKPQSPYRPTPATPEMKELYRHDVEAEFADVEKARGKGDCAAFDAAIARLTALLNDYRATMRGEANPEDRVIWGDRLARARSQRPNCPSVGPEPAYTNGFVPDEPAKKDAAKPAEMTPNPETAKEEEKKRKRPK